MTRFSLVHAPEDPVPVELGTSTRIAKEWLANLLCSTTHRFDEDLLCVLALTPKSRVTPCWEDLSESIL